MGRLEAPTGESLARYDTLLRSGLPALLRGPLLG